MTFRPSASTNTLMLLPSSVNVLHDYQLEQRRPTFSYVDVFNKSVLTISKLLQISSSLILRMVERIRRIRRLLLPVLASILFLFPPSSLSSFDCCHHSATMSALTSFIPHVQYSLSSTTTSSKALHLATVYPPLFVSPTASPSSASNDSIKSPPSATQPPQKNMIALAAILFAISAALAAAETAITTLWPWKVRELAEKEGPKSPFSSLQDDLTRFLTTILVSTTSATVFSTAIATDLAGDAFGPRAVPYITAGLTVVFLFLGEILPKALAVHAPAKVARIMVPIISLISTIVYPVGKLLAWLSTQILRVMKLPMESNATVSEEELRLIVAGANRSGSIEKYESQIIQNVLDLEDTDVSSVMCPRVDMVAIPAQDSLDSLVQLEAQFHYSRMPVYDETVDNIVGVAMTKSLLGFLKSSSTDSEQQQQLTHTKVVDIMDPAFFVPESMSVWIALEQMRKRRLHMAIVVDEYGGTAGLVTLEDILEEVVGEIYDEDDDYEADSALVRKNDNGLVMIEGQAELDKVEEALDLQLTEEDLRDYGTISGFLCARMGGIPNIHDSLVFNNIKFTIVDANDRRVKSVSAQTLSPEEYERIILDQEEKASRNDQLDNEDNTKSAAVIVHKEETSHNENE